MFLYAPPWDAPTRFSKHHLASFLAEQGNRVLYVEAPLTPLHLRQPRPFARALRAALHPPALVANRLWIRRYFLPLPYHGFSALTAHRVVNRAGQRWLAPLLRRDVAKLKLRQPIVIAGLPHAVDALRWLSRSCLIYHCADDYASVRGFPSSFPTLEAELCRQADLVITTSETLRNDRRQFNVNTYWVPNGADVAHFARPASPARDIARLPRPVIGFVGGLSQWVDIELLATLARARPDWSFALIGPVGVGIEPLHGLGNVHVLDRGRTRTCRAIWRAWTWR